MGRGARDGGGAVWRPAGGSGAARGGARGAAAIWGLSCAWGRAAKAALVPRRPEAVPGPRAGRRRGALPRVRALSRGGICRTGGTAVQAAVRLGSGRWTRAGTQLHVVFGKGAGGGGSCRRCGAQLPQPVAGVGRRAADEGFV